MFYAWLENNFFLFYGTCKVVYFFLRGPCMVSGSEVLSGGTHGGHHCSDLSTGNTAYTALHLSSLHFKD
jgi:hypothetical protein